MNPHVSTSQGLGLQVCNNMAAFLLLPLQARQILTWESLRRFSFRYHEAHSPTSFNFSFKCWLYLALWLVSFLVVIKCQQSTFRKEGSTWGSNLRGPLSCQGGGLCRSPRQVLCCVFSQEVEKNKFWFSACVLFFGKSWTPAHGMLPYAFRVTFFCTLVTTLNTHTHTQGCFDSSSKSNQGLTDRINHHSLRTAHSV